MPGRFLYSYGDYSSATAQPIQTLASVPLQEDVNGALTFYLESGTRHDPAAENELMFRQSDSGWEYVYDVEGDGLRMATTGFLFDWRGEDSRAIFYSGSQADVLMGGNNRDLLSGGGGADRITGGDDDRLYGDAGNDRITVKGDMAVADGGTGTDKLVVLGDVVFTGKILSIETVVVDGGFGDFRALSKGLNLVSDGASSIWGTQGDDRITTDDSGFETAQGGGGDDVIIGSADNDYFQYLQEDFGRDTIKNFHHGSLVVYTEEAAPEGFTIDIQENRSIANFGNGNIIIFSGFTDLQESDLFLS